MRLEPTKQRPPELFGLPTWSWASVRGRVLFSDASEIGRTQVARIVLREVDNDPCDGQTSAYWIITGRTVPGRLSCTPHTTSGETDSRGHTDSKGFTDRVQLRIPSSYLNRDTESLILPHEYYAILPDFKIFAADWESDTEYDVDIIQMRVAYPLTFGLVLWRYGKAIPGSGQHRVTSDKYPIYQRIGLVSFNEFSYDGVEPVLVDWDKAREGTIALE